MRIKYGKIQKPNELGAGARFSTYKGVSAWLDIGKDFIRIRFISAKPENRGECQDFIYQLKKEYPNKKLTAKLPFSPAFNHIADKFKIEANL